MLFFIHIKLVARVLAYVHVIACIKWRRLHMMYGSWDMEHDRPFVVILDHILPFYPPMDPENQNFEKQKKPEDIFIMCTINDSHIMYGSWDMECIGQNFFVTLDHFLPFYSPNNLKNNCLEISSFYTSVPKIMTTCYTVS